MREVELGRAATEHFRAAGLEVYQEVETPLGRADLVARGAGIVAVVECKVSLGLDVLAQARRWSDVATERWVCVAGSKRYGPDRTRLLAWEATAWLGIGLLEVGGKRPHRIAPVRHFPKDGPAFWDRYLLPEQTTQGEAGSSTGGHVTQFKLTAARLVAHVEAHPGVTLGDAVRKIEHHYASRGSARTSLGGLLRRKRNRPAELAGIRIEGIGSQSLLWPAEADTF